MIACLIYLTLTLFVPLRLTYRTIKTVKSENKGQPSKLWAIYWAVYTLLNLLVWMIPFFTYQPFEFLWMLLLVWLYHTDYQGALLLSQIVEKFINQNQTIKSQLTKIKATLAPLGVFEIEQTKSKPE